MKIVASNFSTNEGQHPATTGGSRYCKLIQTLPRCTGSGWEVVNYKIIIAIKKEKSIIILMRNKRSTGESELNKYCQNSILPSVCCREESYRNTKDHHYLCGTQILNFQNHGVN